MVMLTFCHTLKHIFTIAQQVLFSDCRLDSFLYRIFKLLLVYFHCNISTVYFLDIFESSSRALTQQHGIVVIAQ